MKPQPVDDLDIVFGGKAMQLLPQYADIPESFKDWNCKTFWSRFVSDMFFRGGSFDGLTEKPGINRTEAIRHFKGIIGSWEPKHEHKMAGCAYLLSLWFQEPTTETQPA